MNKTIKIFLALALLSNAIAYGSGNAATNCCGACCDRYDCSYNCNECCIGECDGYPYLQARSQGRDAARELIGWQQFINRYNEECKYSVLSVAVEYSRTFRPERIAHALFGNDLVNNCCELLIQGGTPCGEILDPGLDPKHPKAWLGDYFGLPGNYSSRVKFCPRVQNAVIDFNFYWGAANWSKGAYAKLHIPLVWTKWELCMSERVL